MKWLEFSAVMKITGLNPYVLVSKARATALLPNWRKPMPVLVQINGQPDPPWRINMMPIGDGTFYLYLAEIVRKASQTKVGDTVQVRVTFDHAYRNGPMHPMPEWFREALEADPAIHTAWDALPPSRQKEVLRYFDGLKSDEARERNLEKVLFVLAGNEGRFMARDWKDGK